MNWPWLLLTDMRLPVVRGGGDAGMRLDIALMHRLGGVFPFHDNIGFREALRHVAERELDLLGDVRGFRRRWRNPLGDHIRMQERRVLGHRRFHVDDVRQHLVGHVDQAQRLLGDRRRSCRHRGHRVALVQRLVARHAVAREVAEVHRPLADESRLVGDVGEIGGRDHRLHARQRERPRRVDAHDPRMGVRAALHLADELARHRHVGAELGAAGHLVDAIGADRPRADDFQMIVPFMTVSLTRAFRRPRPSRPG